MEIASPSLIDSPKDRGTWLIVFGVFTILLGGVCALLVPLMIFGATVGSKGGGAPMDFRVILPGIAMYAFLAVVFVWLGIGSILAKRWARAIILILAWGWLVMGAIATVMIGISLPSLLHAMPQTKGVPGHLEYVMFVIMGGIFLAVFILIPGGLVLFYGRKSVKSTCEARNPFPCWTDACPLPVLGMSLLLGCTAPMILVMPVMYHSVLPFFGFFLTGPLATVAYILFAIIWGYGAYGSYQLDRRAWWLLLVFTTLYFVSNFLTYWFHDPAELYRLMGLPQDQLATMQNNPMLEGRRMAWTTIATSLPIVVYILFVGRYFRKDAAA